MDETCSMHGRDVYTILVRKPEGERPHGRPGHIQNNIKIDQK
jgi:hypothetical protein